jgi:ADP-ribose pyrophosphatase
LDLPRFTSEFYAFVHFYFPPLIAFRPVLPEKRYNKKYERIGGYITIMKNLEEKTLTSEKIYKGKIIDLQVDKVSLPDGGTSYREIVKHPGAVAIMAITNEQKLVLVRQYRKALEKTIYEIPAGKLDIDEEPKICAKRELQEETGYSANTWKKLVGFYTSPGFADEFIHLYEASQLTLGETSPDEDEFVERVELTWDECLDKISSGEICDAKTVHAITLWKLK